MKFKMARMTDVGRSRILLGTLGGILMMMSTSLFFYPSNREIKLFSKINNTTLSYSFSNIFPVETFVHITMFVLAAMSYFETKNVLSFCMATMGSLYVFIHSLSNFIISFYYYISRTCIPIHKGYYAIKHSSLLTSITILINIAIVITSFASYLLMNSKKKTVGLINANKNDLNENTAIETPLNPLKDVNNVEMAEMSETDNELATLTSENRSNDHNIHTQTSNVKKNINIKQNYDGGIITGYYKTIQHQLDNKTVLYCNILHILIYCEVLWYTLYYIAIIFHQIQDDCGFYAFYDGNNKIEGSPFHEWTLQFIFGITMAFHRGFILCLIYQILFDCKTKETIFNAMSVLLALYVLNIAYIIKNIIFYSQNDNNINIWDDISFLLIIIETLIQTFIYLIMYQLSRLLPNRHRDNNYNTLIEYEWTPRINLFDIVQFNIKKFKDKFKNSFVDDLDIEIIHKNKKYAYCIIIFGSSMFVLLQFETLFAVTVYMVYYQSIKYV